MARRRDKDCRRRCRSFDDNRLRAQDTEGMDSNDGEADCVEGLFPRTIIRNGKNTTSSNGNTSNHTKVVLAVFDVAAGKEEEDNDPQAE